MSKLQTLKSALAVLDTRRVQTMQAGSWRTSDQTSSQRGYGYKWQKVREQFLREHPLCVMCQAQDRVEAATVVDHITPHRGDQSLFWRRSNWQPLCAKGTKYGISAAAYPYLDIKGLTLEQAKAIYLEDFWDVIGRAHPSIKFQVFDAAVNHGLGNAVRILQRAVMVADDGIWGPRSQAALDGMQELRGHNDVLLRFLGFRLKFWASLAKFDQFGRGWTNRGAENLLFAAEDN